MIPLLTTVFARLTDYRSRRSKRHPLSQTLALIVIALLNGEQGLRGIARWLEEHRWQLQEPFKLRGGQVPSYGTVRCALLGVDVEELEQGLQEWAEQVIGAKTGQAGYHLALDGKTVRGSREDELPALHVLAAFVCELGIVATQHPVEDKTNKIPVARDVLTDLTLQGVVVTADALHTQRETTELIVEKGGTT